MEFKVLKHNRLPESEKITSVSGIIVDSENNILTIELIRRGWDIPGGHVEVEDETIEHTLKREVFEEAFIEIKDLKISSVIESYHYTEVTYMIIMTGVVDKVHSFQVNNESLQRKFITPSELLEKFQGDKEILKQIINRAIL
ncbi:NUDIX hydrolase [Patescibacteria group bacterium]